MKLFFAVLVCAAVSWSAHGYDWGKDPCKNMSPESAWLFKTMEDKEAYQLKTNKLMFEPGSKVLVRVLGKTVNDNSMFTGIFLMAKEAGMLGRVAGSWDKMHPNRYRSISCDGNPNAAIAEPSTGMRPVKVEDDVFVWNAPESCKPGDQFEIEATIVNDDEILHGLFVTLNCAMPMTPMKPPKNACAASYTVGVMETSFETDFGGLWNDPMSSWKLTRHKGPTGSAFTGPTSAYDGKYYIYTEASYPAAEGEVAILNLPPGLNGCYCLRMWCHMYMSKGSYMNVTVNSEVQWVHDFSLDKWILGWQSINDPEMAKIQLVLHRGKDFRGDMALDDLSIEPGLCPEDFDDDLTWVQPVWENVKD